MSEPSAAAPVAEVTRRDVSSRVEVVESSHRGHVVVVGPDGTVAGALGDPERVTFVRSAVKAFQATACLELLDERGGAELTTGELAIGQASHRAEPRHLEAVARLLARSGTDAGDLTTPPARAEDQPELPPERRLHNCSGKHALFALAGRAIGCPHERLLDPAGPLQTRVLATLAEVLGPSVAVGTDGCGAPAVAVPLVRLGEAFLRLRTEDRWARVRSAALAEPWLIGGEGRLESTLLGAGVLAKNGAEGVFAAAWEDAAGDAWAIAVKCEDGAFRGAEAAVFHTLAMLGVVPEDAAEVETPLGGGEPAGVVRPTAALRTFAEGLRA